MINCRQKQTGAVLFVSLIILILLTILGLSSLRSTLLQEKMAGNYKDKSKAFQAAETALRAGEKWLFDKKTKPFAKKKPDLDKEVYEFGSITGKDWWETLGRTLNDDDDYKAIVKKPLDKAIYAIEQEICSIIVDDNEKPKSDCSYRIYAYGFGGRSSTHVALSSIYIKKY